MGAIISRPKQNCYANSHDIAKEVNIHHQTAFKKKAGQYVSMLHELRHSNLFHCISICETLEERNKMKRLIVDDNARVTYDSNVPVKKKKKLKSMTKLRLTPRTVKLFGRTGEESLITSCCRLTTRLIRISVVDKR